MELTVESLKKTAVSNDFQEVARVATLLSSNRNTMAVSIPFLKRAIGLAPDDNARVALFDRLAEAFNQTGQRPYSLHILKTLLHHDPANVNWLERYAGGCELEGMFDESSAAFNRLLDGGEALARHVMSARGDPLPTRWVADVSVLLGTFGEIPIQLASYIKARRLGMIPPERLILEDDPSPRRPANPYLINLYRSAADGLIDFVGKFEAATLRQHYRNATRSLQVYRTLDGKAISILTAVGYIGRLWEERGNPPVVRLPEETVVRGRAWLAGLGVPADAWFVTMHIRDGLYRGETSGGLNQFRNSRLELYDEAIRAVVARGGWVIRVGNRGRTLPEQAGVIDCTSMGEYEDWKDIFLLSQCRFVVGSNSGPVVVAQEFDVPVVGVDWFPVNPFPLSSRRSLLIHKILRNGSDGRGLSMGAASTCAYQQHPDYYRERGIQVEENSAGDIRAVVTEMMDRLDGGLTYDADDDAAQRRYEEGCRTLSPYGINFRIGREFLRENAFLTG